MSRPSEQALGDAAATLPCISHAGVLAGLVEELFLMEKFINSKMRYESLKWRPRTGLQKKD